MREEKVTINLLNWLESHDWRIVCYDFPQSGTGVLFHPNSEGNRSEKNKDAIIPDILATKDGRALYFENKDRFYLPDFEKLREIKTSGKYSNALSQRLAPIRSDRICYGIGIPSIERHINKSLENISGLDFLVSVSEPGEIMIHLDIQNILSNSG